MSFARKIFRNAAKAELKERGFSRPNKLAWHREHGVKVNALAVERMARYIYAGKKNKRKAKRRRRA